MEGDTGIPGAKYLFAQRFSWAQYGTFISHLALLMLLLGGLLTALAGDSRTLSLAEKRSAVPLFRDPGPGQIFVEMLDAVKGVDSDGHIIDFRSKFMVRRGDENMKVTITGPDLSATELFVGESLSSNLYEVTFKNPLLVPAINVLDMPGVNNEKVTVQLMKDRWGSDYLYAIGLRSDGEGLVLPIDTTWSSEDGFSFTFLERVDGSGIDVRRDPGDTFIWIAIVLGLLGLGITFYIPRRRLWVSFTRSQIFIAGIAPRSIRFEQELRKLGQAITGKSDTQSNEFEDD